MPITRATVVQRFLDLFDEPTYLEIGVNRGSTFHEVRAAKKVAVDPSFLFMESEREKSSAVEYHEITSDEYFSVSAASDLSFDVIFIDGLHTFDQTLRDLLNAVLLIKRTGVIIVDDVIPNSYDASLADFSEIIKLRQNSDELGTLWVSDGSWMGDVYKVPFFVDAFMQQMSFATVSENHGQTVIWRKTRATANLPQPSFERVSRLDFRDTILSRKAFKLKSIDVIANEVCLDLGIRNAPVGPEQFNIEKIAFEEDQVFSTIMVPGEQMPQPTVAFPELMLDAVRGVQTRMWGSYRSDKTVNFNRLKNVYVVADGIIFNDKFEIIALSAAQHSDSYIKEAAESLKRGIEQGNIPRRSEPALLCGKAGLSNYGHWLIEMLPLVFISRNQHKFDDWKIFVPHIYPWMKDVVRDSLSLLGVTSGRLIENDGAPAWFEDLIVVSGMTKHGDYYLPMTADCLQEIGRGVDAEGDDNVWVSRLGEQRAFLHEAEINDALVTMGWRVIFPREMTLQQQIGAVKGARHLAGVNGAGLTNMGFMSAGGRVTSFVPFNMPDLFFWALAANRKLQFHEVRAQILPGDPTIPWNAALLGAPVDVIRQLQ